VVTDGVGLDLDGNLVGVLLLVDDDGYMNDLEVYPFGATVDGQPTVGRWGKPTVESFELAEWEPRPDGISRTLKNTLGQAQPSKN
jgi:hypothetical protein